MEMFWNEIVQAVAQLCGYTENQWIVCVWYVNYISNTWLLRTQGGDSPTARTEDGCVRSLDQRSLGCSAHTQNSRGSWGPRRSWDWEAKHKDLPSHQSSAPSPVELWKLAHSGSHSSFLLAQMVKNPPAMQKTRDGSLGPEDPLEKGMATHSRILAWRSPWTEEPSGPQSVAESQTRLSDWQSSSSQERTSSQT